MYDFVFIAFESLVSVFSAMKEFNQPTSPFKSQTFVHMKRGRADQLSFYKITLDY